MSETREAEALARWLGAEPGGEAPVEIDPDVVECIIALRPEFALPARVSIDDILASLTDGPLLDPGIADALQRWLSDEPGTPPPAILPIGVIEATYALRPDMAPAARVSIDDILQTVTTGPFAEPEGAVPLESAPVVDLSQERSRRRWWAGPTVGGLLVAATVLLFVDPIAMRSTESVESFAGLPEDAMEQEDGAGEPTIHDVDFALEKNTQPSSASARFGSGPPKRKPRPSRSARTRRAESDASVPQTSLQKSRPAAPVEPSTSRALSPQPMPVPSRELAETPPPPPAAAIVESSSNEEMAGGAIQFEAASAEPQRSDRTRANRSPARRLKARAAPRSMAASDEALEMEQVQDQGRADADFEDFAPVEAPPAAASTADAEPAADASRLSVRMSPTDTAINAAIERAERLLNDGQAKQALEVLNQALQLKADNPFLKARLWRSKARALDALGHETEAQQARKTAAKLDPAR